MPRDPLACPYMPGFLEALRTVVQTAKNLRVRGVLNTPRQREHLVLVGAAEQRAAQLRADPCMCDKFLSLDMREPFVGSSVSEEGDEEAVREADAPPSGEGA